MHQTLHSGGVVPRTASASVPTGSVSATRRSCPRRRCRPRPRPSLAEEVRRSTPRRAWPSSSSAALGDEELPARSRTDWSGLKHVGGHRAPPRSSPPRSAPPARHARTPTRSCRPSPSPASCPMPRWVPRPPCRRCSRSEESLSPLPPPMFANAIAAMSRTTTPTTVIRDRELRAGRRLAVAVAARAVGKSGTGLARTAERAVSIIWTARARIAAVAVVAETHAAYAPSTMCDSAWYDGSRAGSRAGAVW